jgi:uncharacterized protein YjdB
MKTPLLRMALLLLVLFVAKSSYAQIVNAPEPYRWSRFETGGGGYFTGISFSPSTPGLMYVRSDVTPLHRLDPGSDRWTYTGRKFWPEISPGKVGSTFGLGGSTGSAIHPTNDQIVFNAIGIASSNIDGTQGIYRSNNKGTTWEQVLSVYVNSNNKQESGNQRKCGNPLAIDPQNPAVIYAGTQSDGLFRSIENGDKGSWNRRVTVPTSSGGQLGTKSVVVDRFSAKISGRSSIVYASVFGKGVYKSVDGGDTFTDLPGSPKCPQWMVQGPDGTLYATNEANSALGSTGGIWKYNGIAWVEISPAGFTNGSFLGIDVNPFNGNQIAVVANGFTLFKTSNGGVSWEVIPISAMTQSGDFDYTSQGGKIRTIFQAAASVHFDPFENGTLYMCDAFMVWKSTNAFAGTAPIDWVPLYKGLNNSIPFDMMAPPQAPSNTVSTLYAGGADGNNFRYDVVGGKPSSFISNLQGFQNYLTGVDFSEAFPDFLWLVTNSGGSPSQTRAAWNNGGNVNETTSWNVSSPFGSNVSAGGAKIAVSANNPLNAVIAAGNGQKNKVTFNGGTTWVDCRGLPTGVLNSRDAYDSRHPVESDRINGSRFYAFHERNSGEFYRSDDGGLNWNLVNSAIPGLVGAPSTHRVRVAAAPFMEGNVWVALAGSGLHRSNDAGVTFVKDNYFSSASLVDFGANKPGNNNPSVYVHGKVAGTPQWGVFRSNDMGSTWELISPADEPIARPLVIEGDRKIYGRIYISDEAVGVDYGEINGQVPAGTAPEAPSNLVAQVQGAAIQLTWTDNANNETHFKIYRKKTTESSFKIIGLAGFNQLSYADVTWEDGVEYNYYVESQNESGSNASTTSTAIAPAKLRTPSNLVAREIPGLRIALTWQDNTVDEDEFIIEYARADGAFEILATTGANTTSFTHTNPDEQITYTYRVKAGKSTIYSGYSNESSAFVVNKNITVSAVNGDPAHALVLRTIPTNALSTSVARGSIQVGRIGTNLIGCAVYPFQLPALEEGVEINKAQVKLKVDETSSGSNQIFELWTHPARDVSTVLTTDYYDPFFTPAGSSSWTKVNGNFCEASAVSVGSVVISRPEQDADLTSFIKSQYQSNATGKFVFMRINQNSQQQTSRTGFDTRGDADDGQPNGIPQLLLSLTAKVKTLTMTPATATVDAGDTVRLTTKVTPSIANPEVIWTSSDTTIATVDGNGLVSASREGTVTITATSVEGTISASSTVTAIPVIGIKIRPDSVTLRVAETRQLGTNPREPVRWQSDNEAVVSVDQNGLISAFAVGTANITVTSVDSTKTAVSAVTVIEEVAINVALRKATRASSFLNSPPFYPSANAVDGDKSNVNSRWISSQNATPATPQWLEVDLGSNYNINSIKFWTGGATGGYNLPIINFRFQRWDGATWQNVISETQNASSSYSRSFPSVITNKVRLEVLSATLVPGGSVPDTRVRFYELEVYGVPVRIINVGIASAPASVFIGQTEQLSASVVPSNATNPNVIWTSSDTTIATVNATGLVTARACGSVSITATTQEFNKSASVTISVNLLVASVSLNVNSITIKKDSTIQLAATIAPASACDQVVNWTSSDEAIATVDASGLVTAVSAGSVQITATTRDGGKTALCFVTVVIPVTGIAVSPASSTISVSAVEELTATILPANATNKAVVWTSSNEAVATVDANGLVTAVSVGSAEIIATTLDGGKTAVCSVTVVIPVTSVVVSPVSAIVSVGGVEQLTATISPANATNKAVAWTSSNEAIAMVDANGLITGLSPGTATITVVTEDGSKTANAAITVMTPFNVALRKATSVSSVHNTVFTGPKAVDGNYRKGTSKWRSRARLGLPQWIEVDLGGLYKISGMAFWTDKVDEDEDDDEDEDKKIITSFNFQIWDGSVWQTIVSENANNSVNYRKSFTEVSTRKVRLYVTGSSTNFVNLYELEVYGVGTVVNQPSTANELSYEPFSLEIYPNPADEVIRIKLNGEFGQNFGVSLFDKFMQRVRSVNVSNKNEVILHVEDLAEDMYILKVTSASGLNASRIVIIKH